ncbi:MAG: hypothetical protein A2161_02825 [Candidatus Schekmanbacteria bacterium RBG_13_48_7]|uniref:DUF3352 domain-containing protein n=1 Tax=Candidatus Schekmanbacteria bacterium RBG_13_48_7 TaxID=1817878 RepID=A0A1F7RSF9_9BACT|nr:MAG: hypothetical protein A2161_02825 [Candidatus Schekmanbacteria bacterium RBG_13_48_7]
MKKILFWVTSAVLILFSLLTVIYARHIRSGDSALLKNALVYFQFKNMDSFLTELKEIDLYQIAVKENFFEKTLEKDQKDEGLKKVFKTLTFEDVSPLLKEQAEIGLYTEDKKTEIIFSSIIEEKKQFETILDKINSGTSSKEVQENLDGINIFRSNLPDLKKTLFFYYEENRIVGSTSLSLLKPTVSVVKGNKELSLSADSNFKNCYKKIATKDKAYIGYFDLVRISEMIHEMKSVSDKDKLFMGIGKYLPLKTLILGGQMVPEGLEMEYFISPTIDKSKVWYDLLEVAPGKLSTMSYLPQNMLLFKAANQNSLKFAWDYFNEEIEDPDSASEEKNKPRTKIKEKFKPYEDLAGINVESEIIDILGSELVFGITSARPTELFQIPQMILILNIKDQKRCEELMKKVELYFEKKYKDKNGKFETSNYGNYALRKFNVSIFAPVYVIDGDFLLVGTSLQVLKDLLDTKSGSQPGFLDSPEMVKLSTEWIPSKLNALSYFNIGKSAETASKLIAIFGSFLKDDQKTAVQNSKNTLKSLESLGVIMNYQIFHDSGISGKWIFSTKMISKSTPEL